MSNKNVSIYCLVMIQFSAGNYRFILKRKFEGNLVIWEGPPTIFV